MGLIRVRISGLDRFWKVFLVAMVCLLLTARPGHSQTAAEFLRQKATQKKYLLAQIVAFRAYGAQLQKGYEIVGEGLETVSGFTRGEWKLHEDYFGSLKTVSPTVKQSKKIVEIIKMQVGIIKVFAGIRASDLLTPLDLAFIAEVKSSVIDECEKDLVMLLEVTTSGKLEMSDAERLSRLEGIYISMQEKLMDVSAFADEIGMMLRGRKKELSDLKTLKKQYGID